jgi:tripartite-type tricarboxylate transporter receptor subunit TctC
MFKLLLAAAVCLAPVASFGQAAAFPSKPVRVVVPYPAGGATDFVARTIGEQLAKALGQPVIVDNKSGAAGAIGAADVARAPADGHTLLMTITDSQINNVALFKSLPYDPQKDFAFVTQVVRSPALISANADLPVKNMDDFKRLATEQAGKLSYGS